MDYQKKIDKKFSTAFELSVTRSRIAVYFSVIAILKKSHFTIFAIKILVQNTKKLTWIPFVLLESCLKEKWINGCFHREFRVSTQKMVHDYCIAKCNEFSASSGINGPFNGPSSRFFLRFKIFKLIRTLLPWI